MNSEAAKEASKGDVDCRGLFDALFFLTEVQLIYNVCQSLLYSKVTQLYTYRHSFFYILFHYGLSQDIELDALFFCMCN